jgi:hypothetical protein
MRTRQTVCPKEPALYAQILRRSFARDLKVLAAVVMEHEDGSVEESVVWFKSEFIKQEWALKRHQHHSASAAAEARNYAKQKWRKL